MNKYILLLTFLIGSKVYSQNCCVAINASNDTVICKDSVQLHATPDNLAEISCTTGDDSTQNLDDQTQFTINNCLACGEYGACGQQPYLIIAVIDSCSLQAWSNDNVNYGQTNQYSSVTQTGNCRNRPEHYFEFDTSQMNSAVNMLQNIIPVNDYILVYTFETINLSQYPQLINELSSLGSIVISTLGNVPYIFFVKKGFPSTVVETSGALQNDVITLSMNVHSSASISNLVYSWSPGITVNDSTIQSPKTLPNGTTKYYVTVTDTVLHCTSVDSVTINYNCAQGIQENILSDEVIVSPNPSSDYLIIKSGSLKLKRIFLINSIGQLISETDADNSSSQHINAGDIAEGVYFLQIETEKGTLNKKIIVIRK